MRAGRSPRVAFYGNIANNAFNMVNILRDQGIEAVLVDDGTDLFAFSRPCWEECRLDLGYDEVMGCRQTWQYWTDKERELGFESGSRVVTPAAWPVQRSAWLDAGTWLRDADACLRQFASASAPTVHALAGFDLVVAFGLHAAASAFLAERPCLYFTYGGDIRLYLANKGGAYGRQSRALDAILKSPSFAIEAYGCDAEIHGILKDHGLLAKAAYGLLPNINLRLFSGPWDRGRARQDLGWDAGGLIFFMAARVDFEWKASDVFLRAFAEFARERHDATLVVTGWGRDHSAAAADVERLGLRDRVVFLDRAFSKPELFRRYAAADVVVDQFRLGTFGSVSFEALCMGKPVLTYLSPFTALGYGAPPPMLNAATEPDIRRALAHCADDRRSLDELGVRARRWFRETLSAENLVDAVGGLTSNGARSWAAHAGSRRQVVCDKPVSASGTSAEVRILAWPAPYRAGLAFANDCEFYTWSDFCELHTWLNTRKETSWGPGLGLPISDSFWFFSEGDDLGFSYFRETALGTPSAVAGRMRELITTGQLDALHAYGGFDHRGSFTRAHALVTLDECTRMGLRAPVWTNHGNDRNRQNLGGLWPNAYQQGDQPDTPGYHADLLTHLGVEFAWLDAYATNRFSLGNAGGRGFQGGLVRDDPSRWHDRVLCRDRLRDGRPIAAFRRFRGARGPAPDPASLASQIAPANLDHLEASGGAAVVYQHFGCLRDADGRPERRLGRRWPAEAVAAMDDLSERYHERRIWVAPLGRFLRYLHTLEQVRFDLLAGDAGLSIVLYGDSAALTEADLAGLHLEVTGAAVVAVKLRGADGVEVECRHAAVKRHAEGVSVAWPVAEYPQFPFTFDRAVVSASDAVFDACPDEPGEDVHAYRCGADGRIESIGVAGDGAGGAELPARLVIPPGRYAVGARSFALETPGVYKFHRTGRNVGQRVVFGHDPLEALLNLSGWLWAYGADDDALPAGFLYDELLHRRVDVLCYAGAVLSARLLTDAGFASRHVVGLTLDTWNSHDNGHTLVEVRDHAAGWIAYDPSFQTLFLSRGTPVGLLELSRLVRSGEAFEVRFLPCARGVGQFPAQQSDFGFWLEHRARDAGELRRWYRRTLQVALIADANSYVFTGDEPTRDRVVTYVGLGRPVRFVNQEQFERDMYPRGMGTSREGVTLRY
jgi:glycosyltransferase involved in cell wall biosynthesis